MRSYQSRGQLAVIAVGRELLGVVEAKPAHVDVIEFANER
jgi:hypothetical protein